MDFNREFDTVKVEKANAIANFRRLRNIAKFFKLFEVLFAFALISWSSTRLPSAVKLIGEYLLVFSGYLFNPHVVFVIGNVIVVALCLLSTNVDGTDKIESVSASASGAGIVSEEEYHEYSSTIDHNAASSDISADSDNELEPPTPVTEETNGDEKQIVCFENAVTKTECEVAEAIETAKKQIRRFQRTQSEKLKRELSIKPTKKDYRRSETEVRRLVVNSRYHGGRALTSFDTVDRLSNEEFRFKVEMFIKKHNSFLKSQKLAENSQ